jgi:hypothetical protein
MPPIVTRRKKPRFFRVPDNIGELTFQDIPGKDEAMQKLNFSLVRRGLASLPNLLKASEANKLRSLKAKGEA